MKKISLLLAMAVFVSMLTATGALAQTDKEQIATIKRIHSEFPAFESQEAAFQGRYEALKAEKLELEEAGKILSEALKVHDEKVKENRADHHDFKDERDRYYRESDQLNPRYVNTYDGAAVDAYNREARRLNKWADQLEEKRSGIKSRLGTLTSDGDALEVRQWELNEKKLTWNNKLQAFNNEWSDIQIKKEKAKSQFIAACNGLMSKPKTKKTALKLGCGNLD